MSSPRESRRPKIANKIRKSHKENVAQQSVHQKQGLEAPVPAPGHTAMARPSHGHRETEGEPSSNRTTLNASTNAPESFANTSVRLPANCEEWPPAISQFRDLLQTIRRSITAIDSLEPSGTGVLVEREELTQLMNHIQLVEGPVLHFQRFVIGLIASTRHPDRHAPAGHADSAQRAQHDDIRDQWSDVSLSSDGLNGLFETIKDVDEEKFVPTLERLIETVACIAMQLDERDNCNGARVFREFIPPLREVLVRSQGVLQTGLPAEHFTGLNMQAIDALPER